MSDQDALRRMVREVLREVLPRDTGEGPDVRRVQVRDDRDLAALVTQVVNLAEDPAGRADLRAGRIRFSLAADQPRPAAAASPPIEVE